jgi:hypothetical protein
VHGYGCDGFVHDHGVDEWSGVHVHVYCDERGRYVDFVDAICSGHTDFRG